MTGNSGTDTGVLLKFSGVLYTCMCAKQCNKVWKNVQMQLSIARTTLRVNSHLPIRWSPHKQSLNNQQWKSFETSSLFTLEMPFSFTTVWQYLHVCYAWKQTRTVKLPQLFSMKITVICTLQMFPTCWTEADWSFLSLAFSWGKLRRSSLNLSSRVQLSRLLLVWKLKLICWRFCSCTRLFRFWFSICKLFCNFLSSVKRWKFKDTFAAEWLSVVIILLV